MNLTVGCCMITFPATERYCPLASTKLYCFVTEIQLAQTRYLMLEQPGVNPPPVSCKCNSQATVLPSCMCGRQNVEYYSHLWCLFECVVQWAATCILQFSTMSASHWLCMHCSCSTAPQGSSSSRMLQYSSFWLWSRWYFCPTGKVGGSWIYCFKYDFVCMYWALHCPETGV